jgi:hypothetical protein
MLSFLRNRRRILRVFGPDDSDEVLTEIISLATEPAATLTEKVQALVSRFPLSHNLRLMACAALRLNGLRDQALVLIQESLILYPESPMLIERYLNLRTDVSPPVALALYARAKSARPTA